MPSRSPFVVYQEAGGNLIPALAPGQPQPGPEYERCIFDGTWTRASVLEQPVCWPCYRGYGAVVGPAVRSRIHRLAEGESVPVLMVGGAS